ncbi:hypothetical protein EG68_02183 [Paragonimus skrjabini miyazakii]|uniref:Uridylate-specific endoribonuclease n=1 Tax=Paragonimus skrjabini miyazakii TaxID=59628 RepID=A0A8S9Z659_9TREM|nr:hypothetical protein EG68_02183 [Paragonimus skrjabini miyazakii]
MKNLAILLVTAFMIIENIYAGTYGKISYFKQFIAPLIAANTAEKSAALERLLQDLWLLDDNRMEQNDDIEIKLPGGRFSFLSLFRKNGNKLFQHISQDKLDRPTFRAFIRLLDNYEMDTNHTEYMTQEHANETWDFLTEVMNTRVMNRTHQFLADRRLAPISREEFKGQLFEMWFDFHRPRSYKTYALGKGQFSPFEHVFVGELHDGSLSGFHNWIQLYRHEESGDLLVTKYSRKACPKKPHFISIHFDVPKWNVKKRGAYVLLGTSPEFELAAYTAVFLMNVPGKLNINGCPIKLVCIHQFFDKWRPRTCYPKDKFL